MDKKAFSIFSSCRDLFPLFYNWVIADDEEFAVKPFQAKRRMGSGDDKTVAQGQRGVRRSRGIVPHALVTRRGPPVPNEQGRHAGAGCGLKAQAGVTRPPGENVSHVLDRARRGERLRAPPSLGTARWEDPSHE